MPLFEATPVTIVKSSFNGYYICILNKLWPDNDPFFRRGDFTSKFLFLWLQHNLHVLGPANATFLGDLCYNSLT